jgi:hypothetical protein
LFPSQSCWIPAGCGCNSNSHYCLTSARASILCQWVHCPRHGRRERASDKHKAKIHKARLGNSTMEQLLFLPYVTK